MTELNIPLLRKTIEYIEEHPDEWAQDTWASKTNCGTTMCFAGTAAFLAGATWLWGEGVDDYESVGCIAPDGTRHTIENYATEELGLSVRQADYIFYSSPKDVAEMRHIVEFAIGEKL